MKFNNTTFREGYNPTFSEFKKSHSKVIATKDMAEAYELLTGKKPSKRQLKDIEVKDAQILDNGNTSTATPEGSEDNASDSK